MLVHHLQSLLGKKKWPRVSRPRNKMKKNIKFKRDLYVERSRSMPPTYQLACCIWVTRHTYKPARNFQHMCSRKNYFRKMFIFRKSYSKITITYDRRWNILEYKPQSWGLSSSACRRLATFSHLRSNFLSCALFIGQSACKYWWTI